MIFKLITLALAISVVNGDCAWREDRTLGAKCTLNTIEATVDLSEVSDTTRLHIQCDHALLYESILPKNIFKKFHILEELHIDGCKLLHLSNSTFAGLEKLRMLTINTGNSAWGQANKLELDAGVFANFSELQTLTLTNNNIRSLKRNVFCPLKSLTTLNISQNRIRSTDDLGFNECTETLSQLRSIDLSTNELSVFEANWTSSDLRSLQKLYLQENNITKLSLEAFEPFVALKVLNLSINHLETLNSGIFRKMTDLQELYLQQNKLYLLPVDLFATLADLLILDLSGNQLSSHYIASTIFAQMKRLVVLNLANNALTRIDALTFSQLNFLQSLDLKNNSIGFIDDQTFVPLTNLHTLNLAGNRLHIINNDIFNGLYVLSRLVLTNNLITVIEAAAFKNCSSLKELDLSSNQLMDVPTAVTHLPMLRSLDLGENRISAINNNSFVNLNQLTGLRLMDNLITNITCGPLYDLPKLNVLNMARNKLQLIALGAFDRNKEIEAIRLDKNLLSDIDGVFATLNSLLWLNLSENQLVWFDYAFIPMNLKWLDVHGNYIESLSNYYKLQHEISVTTLDASHNRITELGPTSVPNSIALFFVNNNIIRNIYPNTFLDKINLTRVDLYSNSLAKLHLHSIRIAAMRISSKQIPEFYLGGNPFECDCSMAWLRHRHGDQHHPRIMDYESIECLVAHKRNQPVRLLSTLSHTDFLCRYETQCPATCHCCEFATCHCMVKCPDACSCFHDQSGAIMKINCGKQNAATIPDRLPADSTHIYVDGNNYLELKNHAFGALKKINTLYLNNSNIITVQQHALVGLNSLHKLHLEQNKLTVLYGYELSELTHLRELYLQNNLLTFLENGTFAALYHLQVLRLDGNRIAHLTIWQMQHMRSLKSLTLADNLWSCGCEFLSEFLPFVYGAAVPVTDANDLLCYEGAEITKAISANMSIGACAEAADLSVRTVVAQLPEGIPHGYVPLLGFGLTIILVLAVLVAVFTVKEQLCCATVSADGKHSPKILYDALILTAQQDAEYVAQSIASELRHSKPALRIGVQHRNVAPTNIPAAANSSKKIIIYLTNAFLQTEWKRPDVYSTIANSWIPGKIILIQTPNLHFTSNSDRELINNIGKGIVLLRTWEIDFSLKLAYAVDTHPSHYMQDEKIWKSNNSRIIHPYTTTTTTTTPYSSYLDTDSKNDSYYSSATAESVLSHSPGFAIRQHVHVSSTPGHVYAGIDSDYGGSVTNEDSISVHKTGIDKFLDTIPTGGGGIQEETPMMSDRDCNGYLV